jgi:hypothetical protein
MMTTRTTFFLLGVVAGATAPVIVKAARPLAAYALAGGMLAYEVACDALESSRDAYRTIEKTFRREDESDEHRV